ncbi:hypothetical protein [Streptomyces sp. 8N706]|uniref:hypothetical protein n=1 Tax=Streptomyces sp. 8N706 TaxID=3457416 RepID=UPI003FD2824D
MSGLPVLPVLPVLPGLAGAAGAAGEKPLRPRTTPGRWTRPGVGGELLDAAQRVSGGALLDAAA